LKNFRPPGKPIVDDGGAAPVVPSSPAEVQAKLVKWFPDLKPEIIKPLLIFHHEIVQLTKSANIVAPSSVPNLEAIFIADSILASRLIIPKVQGTAELHEFGGGTGCPGLVFAALESKLSIVVVERDNKKAEFIKRAAAAMGLKNVRCLGAGVDDLPGGSVRYAVSRGAGPLQNLLLGCRKLMPRGSTFFHMKSDSWATELAAIPSQIFSHWSPSLAGKYRIPDINSEMFVVQTEKISE
jgi:16S rRNA (guanine527-N7)-methyltransferase